MYRSSEDLTYGRRLECSPALFSKSREFINIIQCGEKDSDTITRYSWWETLKEIINEIQEIINEGIKA